MKQITITQYAKEIGMTRQGVLYRINKHGKLEGVEAIKKVGSSYILTLQKPVKQCKPISY